MGRSTSCFKIITCGSDSADKDDDVEAPEVKGDKKGWSFRKRSARHRVLSNTAVSETSTPPPDAKKEAPESADISFQTPITSNVPEKVFDAPEKVPDVPERVPDVPERVPDVPERVPDVPERVPDVPEKVPDVSVQDVRGNDPEKVSYVNETVLVRESAGEKLQVLSSEDSVPTDPDPVLDDTSEVVDSEVEESAAVFIQTAVRAFLGQRELEKLKKVIKLQAAVRGHLVRNHAVGTLRCIQAIVKMQLLVRARRARMSASVDESGPDQKQDKDNVNNRPSPTYVSINKLLSNRFARQLLDSTPKEKPIHMKCEISQTNSAWTWLERWMSASAAAPSPEPSPASEPVTHQQKSDNIPSHKADTEDLPKTLPKSVDLPLSVTEPLVVGGDDIVTDSIEICESQSKNVGPSEEQNSPFVFSSVSSQTFVLSESAEVVGEEKTEEPKRSMKRSASDELENDLKKSTSGLKVTNPAFMSAQSSFEELSSNWKEEKPETECGTELSISSTLDSPDHFDGGAAEIENNDKIEMVNNSTQLDVTDEAVESTVAAETESHDQEVVKPDIVETSQQESYVASPERCTSVLESQGTPASQASVNTGKGSKRGPTHKRKSLSANKASPSHLNNDSGSSSAKQSGKDEKSGKRRGTTTKSENNIVDQEGRDSSSSSSVPHFMQATQSAKAKISANSSPRSSPDVQDREVLVKKRLSLPGANGRQGSPRIQRATSQPVPAAKVNGPPVQERKWLR